MAATTPATIAAQSSRWEPPLPAPPGFAGPPVAATGAVTAVVVETKVGAEAEVVVEVLLVVEGLLVVEVWTVGTASMVGGVPPAIMLAKVSNSGAGALPRSISEM